MADLTIADWKTYAAARGQSAVAAADDADLTTALARGIQSVDARYANQFPGAKAGGRSQANAWPRTGASDRDGNAIANDEVPEEYVHSCFEMSLRELAEAGSTLPDATPDQRVKRFKEGVGPLAEETEYFDTGTDGAIPVFALIEGIIAPILRREGGTMALYSLGA